MGLSPGRQPQPLGARPGRVLPGELQGTVNVLDAALAAGAERVLHTSTESILTKAGAHRPDR